MPKYLHMLPKGYHYGFIVQNLVMVCNTGIAMGTYADNGYGEFILINAIQLDF